MASERRSKTRAAHQAGTTPDGEAPSADLEMTVPTDRDHASVVAIVECALVELTHKAVGAVIVSQQVGRSTRTQYVTDDVGEQFQKRHFDDRLGWHETTVPRRAVRAKLITQLTQSPSTPAERSGERAASEPDAFMVKPVRYPDAIAVRLNQRSRPILAQCWLTMELNPLPRPHLPPTPRVSESWQPVRSNGRRNGFYRVAGHRGPVWSSSKRTPN
jgi:hypothetical protein